jgi:hypothetical protein
MKTQNERISYTKPQILDISEVAPIYGACTTNGNGDSQCVNDGLDAGPCGSFGSSAGCGFGDNPAT